MLVSSIASTAGAEPGAMKAYPTRYYIIYTDLDQDGVREAAARMTAMAEEYHERTKGFAGTINSRMPFYLFSNIEDYYRAGGPPGSAGVYSSAGKLMAIASPELAGATWHVVQHEGFHQFADKVIRGRLPIWVNEGLAEYFGGGIWTGDNFVTGIVTPSRLKRIKGMLEGNRLLPFPQMIMMTQEVWNIQMKGDYYDQAWSMVHFLVHGDGGKYRPAFESFLVDISKGTQWMTAFIQRFGRDTDAFQKSYKDWWLAQQEAGSQELYITAVAQTMTSFLARARLGGQKFKTAEEFLVAADTGDLKVTPEAYLPPSLLKDAVASAKRLRTWSLGDMTAASGKLILTLPNGPVLTGQYVLSNQTVQSVRLTVKKPLPKTDKPKEPSSPTSSKS